MDEREEGVAEVGEVVLPGQRVVDGSLEEASSRNRVVLGPGLRRLADRVYVCKAGILRRSPTGLYVCAHQKKYVPARDETVVGVVTKKIGDLYRVDIGAAEQAVINYLSFEGSTKKIRPNVEVGDPVYARLLMACPDMEPELVCVNSLGKRERLGVLPAGGHLLGCSLQLARKLRSPRCPLLRRLGEALAFDVAVGLNGRVWLKGVDPATTVTVGDAVLAAELQDLAEIDRHTAKIVKHFGVRRK